VAPDDVQQKTAIATRLKAAAASGSGLHGANDIRTKAYYVTSSAEKVGRHPVVFTSKGYLLFGV
jgi:hypothetical protein